MELLSYEWVSDEVKEGRSLMKIKRKVGDGIIPWKTSLLMKTLSMAVIAYTYCLKKRRKIKKYIKRMIFIEIIKFKSLNYVSNSIEGFRNIMKHRKRFTEMKKSREARVRKKGLKITN